MLGIIYKADRVRAFSDKMLCRVIDETRSINEHIKYLIIALCAPDTNLHNAVRAISRENILLKVMSDLTLTSGRDRTS